MKENAFDYLMEIKETHSKMDNLMYTELKMQNYLKDDSIQVNDID